MSEKKPWYEDIKERFENLDTRETLLQKEVARLSERVDWLIQLRVEERNRGLKRRFLYIALLGLLFSILNLVINYLGLIK